jgi:hypothetical protein
MLTTVFLLSIDPRIVLAAVLGGENTTESMIFG